MLASTAPTTERVLRRSWQSELHNSEAASSNESLDVGVEIFGTPRSRHSVHTPRDITRDMNADDLRLSLCCCMLLLPHSQVLSMAAVGELAVHGSPGDFVEDFVQPSIVPDLDLSQTRCIYDHAVFGHEQLSADCCVTS